MKQLSLFEKQIESTQPVPIVVKNQWTLWVDGASRGNPGPSGAGIVINKNNNLVVQCGYFLGKKTNNQAEYLALILGLLLAREHLAKDDNLLIISDSELLIKQMKKHYKVRDAKLTILHAYAMTLAQPYKHEFRHVLRAANSQADAMANDGVDKKNSIPEHMMAQLRHEGLVV